MKSVVENRVAQLLASGTRHPLKGRKIGLEKESLRVAGDGSIAQTPHPRGLGSALTHPGITTDYSEALLEFVTPPFEDFAQTLQCLDETHRFVHSRLGDEILWASSMPCVVAGESSIPIAEYGVSNAAKMKTAYRRGLGHRYGRVMQAIAGVHYNYSYPAGFWSLYQSQLKDPRDSQTFINESYMGMVRNLQRYGWLVPYLFGASPAICHSFLGDAPTSLHTLYEHTYYGPFATSLRMGDIGYQNNKEGEAGVAVNYNTLRDYIKSLTRAISAPSAKYEKIPLCADGQWQQLNQNILQIENEYYSTIRPKQVLDGEEKPTLALARRGIAYIELRSLDVDPYEPLGINQEQMRFLESFLLFTSLLPSEALNDTEKADIKYNFNAVAQRGRDPRLCLRRSGQAVLLRDWALEVFEQLSMTCELLDRDRQSPVYCSTLQQQWAKIEDPEQTPSARVLAQMQENHEEFFDFSLRLSLQHRQWFEQRPLDKGGQREFAAIARDSQARQTVIEQTDDVPFSVFLQNYFDQT